MTESGPENKRKRVVTVVGPPRSGTSAITRALECLDVDLGDPESHRPADSGNPKGVWEDRLIIDLCARALASFGLPWYGLQLFAAADWQTPQGQNFIAEAADIISRRLATAPDRVWGCKNPQIGRINYIWLAACRQVACDDAYVIALRNPLNVAASIIRGSPHFGVGCNPTHLHLMWLVYQIGAMEPILAGKPAVVVDFDAMLADPVTQLNRMSRALNLPADPAAVQAYQSGFLQKDLCHSTQAADDLHGDPRVPALVRRTYSLLSEAAFDRIPLSSPEFRIALEKIAAEARDRNPMFRLIDQMDQRLVRSRALGRMIYRNSPGFIRRWMARFA